MPAIILLYHRLEEASCPALSGELADLSVVVTAADFKKQLAWLSATGKAVGSLRDIVSPEQTSHSDGDRVVLTFDDGHKSDWSLAFPALLEAGMVATFYVVAGFVDRDPQYVTSDQLREMATHGMSIGSHGMTHRWLRDLPASELRREVSDSRTRLEDILQQPVLDFALPGGHFNRAVLETIRDSGYRSIATSKAGIHRDGDDLFRLPRLEIRRGMSVANFRSRFRRGKLLQLRALEAAKTCLRNSCGLSRYMKLRRLAHRCLTLKR